MGYTVPRSSVIDYPAEALETFHVYGYEWIDNLHFVLPAQSFVTDPTAYLGVARKRFLEAGWDGDGDIGVLWLPPFVFPMTLRVPPVGVAVWHVKQIEDGTSWLLSPIELPFEGFAKWLA